MNDELICLQGIPIPPSVNQAYSTLRNGRRVKSQKNRIWQAQFRAWSIQNLGPLQKMYLTAKELYQEKINTIQLKIEYGFRHDQLYTKQNKPKKLDIDNRAKLLLDALCPMLSFDDSAIGELILIKSIGNNTCRVEFSVVMRRNFRQNFLAIPNK